MKRIAFSTLVMSMALLGCKPESEFDGPSLNDYYGDFFIVNSLTISDDSLDLASGESAQINATFSKNLNLHLSIEGLSSGATYQYDGFTNVVDLNWNGRATNLPMFHQETCVLQLTIDNQIDTLRDTLLILSERPAQGFVVADFENGLNPGWLPFVQSGANMSFVVSSSLPAGQGSRYYDMGGQVTWDWLIGMMDFPGSAYGAPHFPLSSNGNNIYFNTFLYKPENINNGLVLFQFREDDNGDGVYTTNQEDMFSLQITPSQNGWQHIYRKYDDLLTLVNGNEASPIGNGLHEPDKLLQVSVLFLANPASGYSQCLMDNIVFTEGGPLQP
ncbi:MAG: hypothetical protein ACKO66_03175 [Flavobacteriales bacterium]